MTVAKMSPKTVDVLLGEAPVLDAGTLAMHDRLHTTALTLPGLDEVLWKALKDYPVTPTLADLEAMLPEGEWVELPVPTW